MSRAVGLPCKKVMRVCIFYEQNRVAIVREKSKKNKVCY